MSFTQKLETVHSFAREVREESWYMSQQKLWKEEVDKNKSNGEAWLNYFRASRALSCFLQSRESDSKKSEETSIPICSLLMRYVNIAKFF